MSNIEFVEAKGEADMGAIKQMFESAANAIVRASQLGKEVGELRQQVSQLTEDVNAMRVSNEELTRELQALRVERTELQSKLWQAEADAATHKANHESEAHAHNNTKQSLEFALGRAAGLRDELDSTAHKLAETQALLREANERLASIRTAVGEAPKAVQAVAEAAAEPPTPEAWKDQEDLWNVWNVSERRWEKQIRNPDGTFGENKVAAAGFDY